MSQEAENVNDSTRIEQAEMVAYLDGELDVQQVADVEKRLSEDPEYRVRLQQLQQAWDLLDELPRSKGDEQFTRSTVEIVVVKAREEARVLHDLRCVCVLGVYVILVDLFGDLHPGTHHASFCLLPPLMLLWLSDSSD